MTKEAAIKDYKISLEIEKVEKLLDTWKSAKKLYNGSVNVEKGNSSIWVPVPDNAFEAMKAISIAHYTKVLADLTTEFDNL